MTLLDLLRLQDKEVETILGKDGIITPGRYIYTTDQRIELIIARNKHYLITKQDVYPIVDVTCLTYKYYLSLKSKLSGNISVNGYSKILSNQLLKYYNEDNICISTFGSDLQLIMYYPTITVTNEHEQTHNITDVYVRYIFNTHTSLKLRSISLTRGSYTVGETNKNYMFSHVSASSLSGYTDMFCFGNTDLSSAISRYRNKMQISQIIPFIFSMESYLSWESISGAPYIYINSIKDFKITKVSCYVSNVLIMDTYYGILKDISCNYEYIIVDGLPTIRLDYQSITKYILDYLIKTNNYEFIGISNGDSLGDIEKIKINQYKLDKISSSSITFKNKAIFRKIIETQIDDVHLKESPHPKLVSEVIKHLEHNFTNYLYKFKNNLL